MIIIKLVTTDYVYGAADQITLRTSLDNWEENDIEAKEINDGIWKFELSDDNSDDKYLNGFEFKFVINRKFWSNGNNFIISGKEAKKYHNENRPHQYHLNNFGFELPTHDVFRIDYVHVNEEYRTLRAEIQRRSQDQQNIVNASIASFAALLSALSPITDSDKVNSGSELFNSLLLISPWVFLNLGILWCDHDKSIHNIAIYIRDVLENRCFPSITPNLNFPAIVNDEDINPYIGSFKPKEFWWQRLTKQSPKKLNRSKQKEFYSKLKSVGLGWEKARRLLCDNSSNKNWLLGDIFPLIYFFLPSFISLAVYSTNNVDIVYFINNVNNIVVNFLKWSEVCKLLMSNYFWLQWIPFLTDLYLICVFITYWRQSIQTRSTLFWNDN